MKFKFNEQGLIPAIIQDYQTKEVLMLGYMNEESIGKTIADEKVWFYSRSRQQLWLKGETSQNYLNLVELKYDCDQDALLILAQPDGPTCHTNEISCFHNSYVKKEMNNEVDQILYKLQLLINERKNNLPEDSYTTYLFEEGIDKILKKVGEEASEVIIASKNDDPSEVIYEVSDLIYHLLVLLRAQDIDLQEIYQELSKRFE
jgi:phosphoribosyl-ATP pyrophosphohydrolase/phosphoribosyl-AMP cyclohydrolase